MKRRREMMEREIQQIKKPGFLRALLLGCFMVVVNVEAQAPSSFLYHFNKERGFFFDTEEFENTVFFTDQKSLFSACELSVNYVAICDVSTGQRFYAKRSELEEIPVDPGKFSWKLKIIDVKGSIIDMFFAERSLGLAEQGYHPLMWIEGLEKSNVVKLHFFGVIPSVQFSTHNLQVNAPVVVGWQNAGGEQSIVQIQSSKIFGLKTLWENAGKLRVEIVQKIEKTQPVVIDAGHGGAEYGTHIDSIMEKELVLKAALRLKKYLESNALNVLLVRQDDKQLSLSERLSYAESQNAALFLSLHVDNWVHSVAFDRIPVGLSCYYQQFLSASFASTLCQGIKEKGYPVAWAARRSMYVLSSLAYPSVLLELGNLADPGDKQMLLDEYRFKAYVEKIGREILDFVKENEN